VLLGPRGEPIADHADTEGALACAGRFRPALESLLARWPAASHDVPVVMSGMVGLATGWQAVPYLASETPLGDLARHVERVPMRLPAGTGTSCRATACATTPRARST
jgi:2-dehydro-3-deoxygalactonokinase